MKRLFTSFQNLFAHDRSRALTHTLSHTWAEITENIIFWSCEVFSCVCPLRFEILRRALFGQFQRSSMQQIQQKWGWRETEHQACEFEQWLQGEQLPCQNTF